MGSLTAHNVRKYSNGIDVFVETGTYMGDSLAYASKFDFQKLYSIELLKKYYDLCMERFKDDSRISLINDNSIDALPKLIDEIKDKSCLYWLDAHLPDIYDSKKYSSDYTKQTDLYVPLKKELDIITNKDISKDVFIIDDLRIYVEDDYEDGNWDGFRKSTNYSSGIDFIYEYLSETHNIKKELRAQGYLICTPKNYNITEDFSVGFQ